MAAIVALALAAPSGAFAAAAPVASYDVRSILAQGGARGLVVSVQLRPDVALPAEVRVPVPKGVTIDWVGEILGGDPSLDPKATYRTESGPKTDTLVFTLTKARRGQAEMTPPQTNGSAAIDLVAPTAADSASLVIEVLANAAVTGITGGLARASTGTNGLDLYGTSLTGVRRGEPLRASLKYSGGTTSQGTTPQGTTPQGTALPTTAGSSPSPIPPPQALLALVGILAVTFIMLKRVTAAPTAAAPATHGGGSAQRGGSPRRPSQRGRQETRRDDATHPASAGAGARTGKAAGTTGASSDGTAKASARRSGTKDRSSAHRDTEVTE